MVPSRNHRTNVDLTRSDVLFDLRGHSYHVHHCEEIQGDADSACTYLRLLVASTDFAEDCVQLTRRQQQIARLLAARATNTEIAGALGISVHTARHHSQRVLEKLGLKSRVQVRNQFGQHTKLSHHAAANGRSRRRKAKY